MNYRSLLTLNKDLRSWSNILPKDLDLIVGIPRSGLLVANILALHMDLLFTDLDGFLIGRIFKAGRRDQSLSNLNKLNVLVVDDSVNSSGQMNKVRQKILDAKLPHNIYFSAVYVRPGQEKYLDFYYEILNIPRIFEWNLKRNPYLLTSCIDIDGVLCKDPNVSENDDGKNYKKFLKSTIPLMIPSKPVGWLVTGRLEKYRKLTEQWLNKYKISYRELIMMDFPSKLIQSEHISHAAFKAHIYQSTGAELFIESSTIQSIEIAFLSQKNVLCMETREIIPPIAKEDTTNRLKAIEGKIIETNKVITKGAQDNHIQCDWSDKLQKAVKNILSIVSKNESFILIDDDQLGVTEVFASRKVLPFLEKDGKYNGAPSDDDTAIREFKQLQTKGAKYLIIAWPSFWWLDYYINWAKFIELNYQQILKNDELIAFKI